MTNRWFFVLLMPPIAAMSYYMGYDKTIDDVSVRDAQQVMIEKCERYYKVPCELVARVVSTYE